MTPPIISTISRRHKTQKTLASMVPQMKSLLILGLAALRTQSSQVQAFATTASSPIANSIVSGNKMSTSTTALDMARTRGLERQEEGATPLGKFSYCSYCWQDDSFRSGIVYKLCNVQIVTH